MPFRVVSRVPLPVLDGFVGLGDGAVFTIHGYEAAVCPPGDAQDVCRRAVEGTSLGTILTTMVSGPRGRAAVSHLLDADQSVATLPITPTSLVNFGEAVNFPLIFGGILALFGAATLIHLLLVSVSRAPKGDRAPQGAGVCQRPSGFGSGVAIHHGGLGRNCHWYPAGCYCWKGNLDPVRQPARGGSRLGRAHLARRSTGGWRLGVGQPPRSRASVGRHGV